MEQVERLGAVLEGLGHRGEAAEPRCGLAGLAGAPGDARICFSVAA